MQFIVLIVVSFALLLTRMDRQTQAVGSFRNVTALDAKEGDVPYIALIKVKHPHTGRFMPICHGSIISEHDVLTNAVCASACQHPPNCKLYVGRVHVDEGGFEIKINKTVWDRSYLEMNMVDPSNEMLQSINDLGLIHTEQIPMSDTIQIIPLVNTTKESCQMDGVEPGLKIISGWGSGDYKNFTVEPKYHEILKYGMVNCFNHSDKTVTRYALGYDSVRAKVSDMGAPLVNPAVNKLIGVGTFAMLREDADRWAGNVYISVFHNLDWIGANMCVNCSTEQYQSEKFELAKESSADASQYSIKMVIIFVTFLLAFAL